MIHHEGKYIRMISEGTWEYVERVHSDEAVVIVATTKEQKAILIEQYRVPLKNWIIEWPAGLLKDPGSPAGETPEEAAKRELLEETGYEAGAVEFIFKGPPTPGLSSEIAVFYRAKDVQKMTSGGGIEGEKIVVHAVDLTQIDSWLTQMQEKGCQVDPKVYAGLYFLKSESF